MPLCPACMGAPVWMVWAPTAACVPLAMGAPAASWTSMNARASRARMGACAMTWSTGEESSGWRVRGWWWEEPDSGSARFESCLSSGSGVTAQTRAMRVHAVNWRCWSAPLRPASTMALALRAWGASAASAGQVGGYATAWGAAPTLCPSFELHFPDLQNGIPQSTRSRDAMRRLKM